MLTASDSRQAEGYRRQLEYRKDRVPKNTEFIVVPDEGNRRVGSAGEDDTKSWNESNEILTQLEGYKESGEKLAEIDKLFEQYNEKLNKQAYDTVSELL